MRLSRSVAPLLALSLAVSLAACGFQPRGSLTLPEGFGPLAVTAADPYSPLADGLRTDLSRAGAATAAQAEGAAQLRILEERWETRPLSVDAFVQVREVETRYAVDFELVDAAGVKRIEKQTLELSREYVYEAAESFGNPGEQEIIQRELRRDMQAAVLRRVDIALRGND